MNELRKICEKYKCEEIPDTGIFLYTYYTKHRSWWRNEVTTPHIIAISLKSNSDVDVYENGFCIGHVFSRTGLVSFLEAHPVFK